MKNINLKTKSLITIILTIVITIAFIIPIPNLKINPDLESYIPNEMNFKKNSAIIHEIFGESEPILIVIETVDVLNPKTLFRIKNICDELQDNENFGNVYSIFQAKDFKSEDGFLIVNPILQDIPSTEDEIKSLRKKIINNEFVYKKIVSEDFKYTLIILKNRKTLPDNEINNYIHSVINKFPGNEKIYVNSMAILRDEANNKIAEDLMLLLPLGLMLMTIFLSISFRNLSYVFLPISIVFISIIFSFGLMGYLNKDISLIGILIPIMMIAIANNYGIHIISRYRELKDLYPHEKNENLVKICVKYLKQPVVITGLTTIAGILGLATHILIPAREMGYIASISIGIALLLSLTFIPAMLVFLNKQKNRTNFTYQLKNKILTQKILNTIIQQPVKIILIIAFAVLVSSIGLIFFHTAADNNNVLPEKHEFNKAVEIVDKNFGGAKFMYLLFQGDARSPEILKNIDHYAKELKKNKNIGNIVSLADIVKKLSTVFHEPNEPKYDKIPDTYEAISQYLLLYSMSGNPEDIEQFTDFNYEYLIMSVQFKANNIKEINNILKEISKLTENDKNFRFAGGYSLVDKEICESVVTGQYYSLVFAFFAIIIMLIIIFRSVYAGLLGSLPLVTAIICTFGIMGWTNIELNIVTALLTSISIGLGVDYTIHIFWRIKHEAAQGETVKEAVKNAISNTGKGIIINGLSVVIGFSVLLFSSFPIVRSFAVLIILSILICLICALILIPAICVITKPKFLFNQKK